MFESLKLYFQIIHGSRKKLKWKLYYSLELLIIIVLHINTMEYSQSGFQRKFCSFKCIYYKKEKLEDTGNKLST